VELKSVASVARLAHNQRQPPTRAKPTTYLDVEEALIVLLREVLAALDGVLPLLAKVKVVDDAQVQRLLALERSLLREVRLQLRQALVGPPASQPKPVDAAISWRSVQHPASDHALPSLAPLPVRELVGVQAQRKGRLSLVAAGAVVQRRQVVHVLEVKAAVVPRIQQLEQAAQTGAPLLVHVLRVRQRPQHQQLRCPI